jgi:hypothetical protein
MLFFKKQTNKQTKKQTNKQTPTLVHPTAEITWLNNFEKMFVFCTKYNLNDVHSMCCKTADMSGGALPTNRSIRKYSRIHHSFAPSHLQQRVMYSIKRAPRGICYPLGERSLVLNSKLSECFECRTLSSGLFPSICSLNANISEHPVCSIFIGTYEDATVCSKMVAFELQTPGNNPEESIQTFFRMHRYNRTYLCQKLNGYGDQRKDKF